MSASRAAASSSSTWAPRAFGPPSCAPTPPSTTSTVFPCCPTRRPRVWSSSTPAHMAEAGSSVAAGRAGRRRTGRRRGHRQPARLGHRLGARQRAPVAPAIGWQDLRTVAPAWPSRPRASASPPTPRRPSDGHPRRGRPRRARAEAGELCFGTVDTLGGLDALGWRRRRRRAPRHRRHQRRRDRAHRPRDPRLGRGAARAARDPRSDAAARSWIPRARSGPATVLDGAPPSAASPGTSRPRWWVRAAPCPVWPRRRSAPVGCSTNAPDRAEPGGVRRGPAGTFPIVAFRVEGRATWGTEAVMLSAGTAVEWLRDDLGVLASSSESSSVAARCASSGDVWFVPALLGLGTPVWDFGARGTLVGLTRGSRRPEIVRAVLEGVAHRGADLVESSEQDSGYPIGALRVDGGMSDNEVFVGGVGRGHRPTGRDLPSPRGHDSRRRVAGGSGRRDLRVDGRPGRHLHATPDRRTRGSAAERMSTRERWLEARAKAEATIPELSGISF